LFSAADESLCKRVLQIELHVLQLLLPVPAKTSFSYNLRHRHHNRQLTRKSAQCSRQ